MLTLFLLSVRRFFESEKIDGTKNEKSKDVIFSDNDDSVRAENLKDLIIQINQVFSIFYKVVTKQ